MFGGHVADFPSPTELQGQEESQRYRLLFFNFYPEDVVLAIHFPGKKGKCFVRAIKEQTDPAKNIKKYHRPERTRFTDPMTISQIRAFVSDGMGQKLGRDIDECIGLLLEDDRSNPVELFFEQK